MRAILHYRAILNNPRSRHAELPQQETATISRRQRSVPDQRAALLTLACDFMFLMVSVGAAIVLRALVMALWPEAGNTGEQGIVEWLAVLATMGGWLWFLGLDAARCVRPARLLPFEYTERVAQHIYLRRMELSLWTVATSLILLCLCMSFARTPLISKLFLSAVIGLVILAVRKSIPAGRLSFAIAASIFVVSMFALAIANMIML
ncbi:MAG: hypothetical protein F6K42_05875 [Leptolyngbya sp. SIO1D8]|nr:hypothetical protein [Leptolyngbya sp. SIO1D8]